MGKNIDVRILNLNKWYVPKSRPASELKNAVVLGYFDDFETIGLQVDSENQYPFVSTYKKLEEKKDRKQLIDHTTQEQMLFSNLCEEEASEDGTCFTLETVNSFWEDKDCPYVFLSMIHIYHNDKLRFALQEIKNIFQTNYLSYVSFDYCDIVIFAKRLEIADFLKKIEQILEISQNGNAVIFDTFSMVSFLPAFLTNPPALSSDQFQATINISIRDHKNFKDWYQELKKKSTGIKLKSYHMFGRHDISIIHESADTNWLLTAMNHLHDPNYQNLFWTFETYIKLPSDPMAESYAPEPEDWKAPYEKINDILSAAIDDLDNAIRNSKQLDNKEKYLFPVYEVRNCICSIIKNNFAEEFVYCIYESFLHFLSFIKGDIELLENPPKDDPITEDAIAEEYDQYFITLNTLVNSTMHSERQFIQATAFNAIFYSVPPKIMAFYSVYIRQVKQILRDQGCKKRYTFLLCPSFSPIISVLPISQYHNPPYDRILQVKISEKSLYDMQSVLYQIVHEVAHYVGNDMRCRNFRKEKILYTLSEWIADECSLDNKNRRIIKQFADEYISNYSDSDDYCSNALKHLDDLKFQANIFLYAVKKSISFKNIYEQYIGQPDKILGHFGMTEELEPLYKQYFLDQYGNTMSQILTDATQSINGDCKLKYIQLTDLIQSVYRECYADLQMILVLNMKAADYLSTFFINLELSPKEIPNDQRMIIRISTIFQVMEDCGIWNGQELIADDFWENIYKIINGYNRAVATKAASETDSRTEQLRKEIAEMLPAVTDGFPEISFRYSAAPDLDFDAEKILQETVFYPWLAANLYEYLLEVMKASLKEYSQPGKQTQITHLRELICQMLAFEDVTSVFGCIETELKQYREEILSDQLN